MVSHSLRARLALCFSAIPFRAGMNIFVISGKRLGKYFDFVPIGRSERVTEEEARKFFLAIDLAWTPDAEEAKSGLEYFLNSVEEIDFDGERLKFFGVFADSSWLMLKLNTLMWNCAATRLSVQNS